MNFSINPIIVCITLVLLTTCNITEIRTPTEFDLNGVWFSQPTGNIGDTLASEISDDFDPDGKTTSKYVIMTDSGIYEHHYEEQQFKKNQKQNELCVHEINLQSDTTGIIVSYKMDTSKNYKTHPRIYGQQYKLDIFKNSVSSIMVITDHNLSDTIAINMLTEQKLVLTNSIDQEVVMHKKNEL